jgi:Mn2+/Fe2+ NRAMP family transporter
MGLNLSQMNRAYLPKRLNIRLYLIAEAAIISTDIGQVSKLYLIIANISHITD